MRNNTVRRDLYWLVRIGQVIVAIVSWVATTYGILAWDNDKNISIDTIMNPSSIGVIALVAAITIFTILLLNFSLQQKNFFTKILLGIFYLIFAFISIGFGYGFWWNKLASTDKITHSLSEDIDRATMNISNVKSHLDGVIFELKELQGIANLKQEIETTKGGSCKNQKTKILPGDGPFSNARRGISESIEKLSKDTTKMSDSVSLLHNELTTLIIKNKDAMRSNLSKNIDISISVKDFRQTYNAKIIYIRNKKIDYFLTKVEDRINILKNALKEGGNFILPETKIGSEIKHCEDSDMYQHVIILSDKIKEVLVSINNAQIKFESEDKSGRIKMALLGVWNEFMPKSLEVEKYKTYQVSPFPLALAVLFDFLLLFFTIVLYKWTKEREYYPNLKRKISEEFGENNKDLGIELKDIFNQYIFKVDNKSYLVYPTINYMNENSSYISANNFMVIIAKLKNIQNYSFKLIDQDKNKYIDIVNYAESKLVDNGWVKDASSSKMEILLIDYPFMLSFVEILMKNYDIDDLNGGKKTSKKVSTIKKSKPSRPANRKH